MSEIIWLIMMKMRMKVINRSHRYDTNRTRPIHGFEYNKYKMCLSMMMVMCNKQHLSNIWNWIHKKIKQHWGGVEKKLLFIKKTVYFSLHDDYPPCLYTAQTILINWNEKRFSKSNILTMDHELNLENSHTMAVRIQDYCVGI